MVVFMVNKWLLRKNENLANQPNSVKTFYLPYIQLYTITICFFPKTNTLNSIKSSMHRELLFVCLLPAGQKWNALTTNPSEAWQVLPPWAYLSERMTWKEITIISCSHLCMEIHFIVHSQQLHVWFIIWLMHVLRKHNHRKHFHPVQWKVLQLFVWEAVQPVQHVPCYPERHHLLFIYNPVLSWLQV